MNIALYFNKTTGAAVKCLKLCIVALIVVCLSACSNSTKESKNIQIVVSEFSVEAGFITNCYENSANSNRIVILSILLESNGFHSSSKSAGFYILNLNELKNGTDFTIPMTLERNQLEVPIALDVKDAITTVRGIRGEFKDPVLYQNGKLARTSLPANFLDVYSSAISPGRGKMPRNTMLQFVDSSFGIIKSDEGEVKQLWVGVDQLEEIELPKCVLRTCLLEESLGVNPGMLDEFGKIYSFLPESKDVCLIEDMEWLKQALDDPEIRDLNYSS